MMMNRNTNKSPRIQMLQIILHYNQEKRTRINADIDRDREKNIIIQFDILQKLNYYINIQLSLEIYISICI